MTLQYSSQMKQADTYAYAQYNGNGVTGDCLEEPATAYGFHI